MLTAAARARGSAVTLGPASALSPAMAAGRPARVAALTAAALRETAACVVALEPPLALIRLPDSELGCGAGDRFALDAGQLRANQRPVQAYFFGSGLRGTAAVFAMRRHFLRLLRLVVNRDGFLFVGFGRGHQHRRRLSLLFH